MAIKRFLSRSSSQKNAERRREQAPSDAPSKKGPTRIARAISSADLRETVMGWVKPKRVRSMGPLTKPENQTAVGTFDAELLKDTQKMVAKAHRALREAAEEDKTMRPGLKFLAKMARASEIQQFRTLFIENPSAAILKIVQGATGHTPKLTKPEQVTFDWPWSTPRSRAVLFDSLVADNLTRNLIVVVATQPNWVRVALRFRRSMLLTAAKQGRAPTEVTAFSTLEMLQATKRLWKVENLTPLQIMVDTVLLSIDGRAPALAGALAGELWQPEKAMASSYVTQISALIGARIRALQPTRSKEAAVDLSDTAQRAQALVQESWTAPVVEYIASRILGAEGAKILIQNVQSEADRLQALGAEIESGSV